MSLWKQDQENRIRSLLLQGVSGHDLTLLALQSADTPDPGRIEVRADLQAEGRKDALLEQVVARLSLEESISSVRWEVAVPDNAVASSLLSAQTEVPSQEAEAAAE